MTCPLGANFKSFLFSSEKEEEWKEKRKEGKEKEEGEGFNIGQVGSTFKFSLLFCIISPWEFVGQDVPSFWFLSLVIGKGDIGGRGLFPYCRGEDGGWGLHVCRFSGKVFVVRRCSFLFKSSFHKNVTPLYQAKGKAEKFRPEKSCELMLSFIDWCSNHWYNSKYICTTRYISPFCFILEPWSRFTKNWSMKGF